MTATLTAPETTDRRLTGTLLEILAELSRREVKHLSFSVPETSLATRFEATVMHSGDHGVDWEIGAYLDPDELMREHVGYIQTRR